MAEDMGSGSGAEQSIQIQDQIESLPAGDLYKVYYLKAGRSLLAKRIALPDSSQFDRAQLTPGNFEQMAAESCFYCAGLVDAVIQDQSLFLLYDSTCQATLYSELGYAALSFKECLPLLLEIAQGLLELHQSDVTHGRLMPENCIILPSRHIKLTEYGLRPFWPHIHKQELPFLDPCIAQGKPRDFHSDQYAFGVILFLAATGHLPFKCENIEDLLQRSHEIPAPVGKYSSDWPVELFDLIKRCLQRDPLKRFSDATQMLREISYFSSEPLNILSSNSRRPASNKLGPAMQPRGERRLQRQHLGWLVFAVLILAVAVKIFLIDKAAENSKIPYAPAPLEAIDQNFELIPGEYQGHIEGLTSDKKFSDITIKRGENFLSVSLPDCSGASVDIETGAFSCGVDALFTVSGQIGNAVHGYVTLRGNRFYWKVTSN